MSVIRIETHIDAPIARCFDLARSIELHLKSTAHTEEKVVGGKSSGLCNAGDSITWEAVHFGICQQLSVLITEVQAPYFFEDRMIKGAFRSFTHQHLFRVTEHGTLMTDLFDYQAPFGILGKLVEQLVLDRYMRNLLLRRNALIKAMAESGG